MKGFNFHVVITIFSYCSCACMVLQEMHTLLIYLLLMYITVHGKIFLKITKVKSEAVIRRRIDNYNCQRQKGQYDKQQSTKHYTENRGSSNKHHT